MKIDSLERLQQIRNDYNSKKNEESVEILVGMATCGISAGARDTFNAFQEELEKQGIENARVIPVGCVGCCHSEPTVQVNTKGQQPVLYGNVKKENVADIVRQHLKDGKPLDDMVLPMNFERV